MPKYKTANTKKIHHVSKPPKQLVFQLHRRRAWWFGVLSVGILLIQLVYNMHSTGQPQVLGYATSISSDALLRGTNDERAKAGRVSLQASSQLTRAAQLKADDMVAKNYWSHVAPDGATPWTFIQKSGYDYSMAGENLAYGFATEDQIIAAWMNSPEHRRNVLGDYSDVGFGFASSSDYQHSQNTVVVALYGLPAGKKPIVAAASSAEPPVAATNLANTESAVNGISTIAGGNAPWAAYASLALVGATAMGFAVTHLDALRSGFHRTRRFAVLHPVIDTCVLCVFAFVILQATNGFIR